MREKIYVGGRRHNKRMLMKEEYYREKLELILRDLRLYTPEEFSRELMRLVVVASPLTMAEQEFTKERVKAIYEHEQKRDKK